MSLEFLKERKKEILIAIGIIGIIIYSLISNSIVFTKDQKENEILYEEEYNLIDKFEENNKIYIHLDGAVKKGGLIELEEGDRLEQAINKSGGLLDIADLRYVNLAMVLLDGEKIYIPSKDEMLENTLEISYMPEVQETKRININNANSEELQKIPGVGPSTAKNILSYRDKNGRFKKVEDIKNVNGIGDSKFEAMLEYISIWSINSKIPCYYRLYCLKAEKML